MAKNTQTKKKAGTPTKAIKLEHLLATLKPLTAEKNAIPALALKEANLNSPIILVGPQALRAKRAVSWIRENFFSDQSDDVSIYFGAEITSSKIARPIFETLSSPSLFARQNLLAIYEADAVKASIAKELAQALEKSLPETLTLLTCPSLEKSTSLPALLAQHGTVVELDELDPNNLRRWIEREAKNCGCSGIEPEAVTTLVNYLGNDLNALAHEIAKLALLCPRQQNIDKSIVESICADNSQANSFALMQRIAQGDIRDSISLAHRLVAQGMHPIQLSFFLSRCLRTLGAQIAKTKNPHFSPSSELNNYWFTKQLAPCVRNFSAARVLHCLKILGKLDFQLKDSAFSEEAALSLALAKLCSQPPHIQP